MILSFFHFYSLVILLVSIFFSSFRYFYVFINFIGDIFNIIVKRYWIALEIALYKFSIIIIIVIIIIIIIIIITIIINDYLDKREPISRRYFCFMFGRQLGDSI